MSLSFRKFSFLMAFMLLVSPGAFAEEESEPPEGPYRPGFGLTGDITEENPTARETISPLIERVREVRKIFLFDGDRRDNLHMLTSIKQDAEAILAAITPSLGDDALVLQGLGEVGTVATMLRVYQHGQASRNLGTQLRTKYDSLRSAHPWNPILRAYAEGAALRQTLGTQP